VGKLSNNSVSLIAWNGRIDFQAPEVDAAGHALARVDTVLAEPMNDIQAAHTVMAKYDERYVFSLSVQARQLGRDGSHGNQIGAGDAGQLEFRGLADIDEHEFLARLETAMDIAGSDFEGQPGFRQSRSVFMVALPSRC